MDCGVTEPDVDLDLALASRDHNDESTNTGFDVDDDMNAAANNSGRYVADAFKKEAPSQAPGAALPNIDTLMEHDAFGLHLRKREAQAQAPAASDVSIQNTLEAELNLAYDKRTKETADTAQDDEVSDEEGEMKKLLESKEPIGARSKVGWAIERDPDARKALAAFKGPGCNKLKCEFRRTYLEKKYTAKVNKKVKSKTWRRVDTTKGVYMTLAKMIREAAVFLLPTLDVISNVFALPVAPPPTFD